MQRFGDFYEYAVGDLFVGFSRSSAHGRVPLDFGFTNKDQRFAGDFLSQRRKVECLENIGAAMADNSII